MSPDLGASAMLSCSCPPAFGRGPAPAGPWVGLGSGSVYLVTDDPRAPRETKGEALRAPLTLCSHHQLLEGGLRRPSGRSASRRSAIQVHTHGAEQREEGTTDEKSQCCHRIEPVHSCRLRGDFPWRGHQVCDPHAHCRTTYPEGALTSRLGNSDSSRPMLSLADGLGKDRFPNFQSMIFEEGLARTLSSIRRWGVH